MNNVDISFSFLFHICKAFRISVLFINMLNLYMGDKSSSLIKFLEQSWLSFPDLVMSDSYFTMIFALIQHLVGLLVML